MPEQRKIPTVSHPAFKGFIGVSSRDITPPVGIYARNWGAAKHDRAEGVHAPLSVRVAAFSAGADGPLQILVSLDFCIFGRFEITRELLDAVASALGVDTSAVLINMTHTHAGGPQCFDEIDLSLAGSEFVRPYLDSVRKSTVSAALEASETRRPAILEWAYGRCGLAANRDLLSPDNSCYLCGFNPESASDDALLVGRVTAEDGTVVAVLVNYACHATTLAWDNNLLSPDYVGAMRDTVEACVGGLCIFFQGASGELAPREQYSGDVELANRHGRQLAYATLSALEGMLPPGMLYKYDGVVESGTAIAVWGYEPSSPMDRLDAKFSPVRLSLKDDLLPTGEIEARLNGQLDRVEAERLRRKLFVRRLVGNEEKFDMPITVWVVGGASIVGIAGEAYSQFQTSLRSRFSKHAVAVMNVTNGFTGYLPPATSYDKKLYEVQQSPFASGALEVCIDHCIQVIDEMLTKEVNCQHGNVSRKCGIE